MKVLDPNDAEHTVTITPRYYPTLAVVVSIFNEADKTTTTPSNTYSISNGFMDVVFSMTVANNEKYQMKITEGTEVVYRTKIWVTDQTPQDYMLTDGLYLYET